MKIKDILFWITLSVIYIFIAFYNGYPLLTSDSGAYINNAYEIYLSDHSLTYSFFLRIFSAQFSLWLPVLVQGGLLTFLTYRISRVLLPATMFSNKTLLFIIGTTSAFTSVSWYSSQLMPDIFTAILILSVILFFLDALKYNSILYFALIFAALMMHNSNLVILFLFSAILVPYTYWKAKSYFKKSISLAALSICSLIYSAGLNGVTGHGFVISTSTHVFLMGKLCENGVLKTYLDDQCAHHNYQICAYKDQLPNAAWDFVWNAESPLNKMGGWEQTKPEYSAILKDLLLSPRYYFMLFYKSIEHTIRQMIQIQVGDGLLVLRENSNPFWKIQQHYNHEMPEYMRSLQNEAKLPFNSFNLVYWLFIVISMLLVVYLMHQHKLPLEFKYVYLMVLTFFILNAFVTANLANVLARLSSRVVWLIPLINIIYITYSFLDGKTKMNSLNQADDPG